MKKNKLLENLSNGIGSNIPTRRYNLADMISESYNVVFKCEEGSNLKKLAESHLDDVRKNPKDIDRLSRQLSIIKELTKLTESGEVKDEDLVDKEDYDTVEPKENRVLVRKEECNECDDPQIQEKSPRRPHRTIPTTESIKEADDPDLTDEELEELAKHLETIRKERKDAPKTEMKEEVSPRRGIKCTMKDSKNCKKGINEANESYVSQYGVDLLSTDGVEDVETRIEMALHKAGLKVLGVQPTDASWSVEDYEKMTGMSINDILGESKNINEAKEEKQYTIVKDRKGKTSETTGTLAELIDKFSYTLEKGKSYESEKGNKKIDKNPKTIASLIKNLNNSENNAAANGYSETSYSLKESNSYRGLENFKKQSESKAFYKTFKKMHEFLKEGKALTRQESIDLYKASNSALTQLSIELEHNPEFLDTFKESVSLLSKDVSSLLESLTRGKAPSKNTMRSLAKFSESLLNESEEEDDIENPEDDFIGDDEGNMQSEEADAFDQEYADARFELHSDLEAKHADDEDPEVQDKLAQDAEEVINLPGTTEEQAAQINGEESTGDSGEENTDDVEEEPEEDDSEITDDELEELKKHLKEMRGAKLKESSSEDEFDNMTVKELMDYCQKNNIKGYMKAKTREELVSVCRNFKESE